MMHMRQHIRAAMQEIEDLLAGSASLKVLGLAGKKLQSKSLVILDSSFNPPHRAHLALIRKALEAQKDASSDIMLMFATNNADKGSKSADEILSRVELMQAFSQEVGKLGRTFLCLTKYPFFKDKYEALKAVAPDAKQVYIVGWDTALRILDPKYYPNNDLATALGPFFAENQLLCAVREEEKWGDAATQRQHMEALAAGQVAGVPAVWSTNMALLELPSQDSLGVSSTKIREALEKNDTPLLQRLLTPEVLAVLRASSAAPKQVPAPSWPTLTRKDVMNCSFSHWHSRFKSVSPRARVLKPLPPAFLHYLHQDGLMLPQDAGAKRFTDLSDTESESESASSNFEDEGFEEEDPTEAFSQLHALIADEIAALGGAVVPKLNWSAPRDALWITADKTLKCTEPSDIYLLLKSSDFILHDLEHAFDHCSEKVAPLASEEHELVLKKWFNAQPSMEFRCFVKDRQLIGLSQRDANHYEFLEAQTVQIARLATRLFQEHLLEKFENKHYVFDAYISVDQDKVWLMDISPFAPSTDALLFSWDELLAFTSEASTGPQVRLVSKDTVMSQGPQFSAHQVPFDLVDASDGVDVAEFARSFQTKLASAALD